MRDAITQFRARQLRHRLTDAEQHLWKYLRRRHIGGYRFRRQVPIGPYIADFACLDPALVIEIDGSQHADQAMSDGRRDAFLRSRGFRVLRFWNSDVLQQTAGVLEVIRRELEKPPT